MEEKDKKKDNFELDLDKVVKPVRDPGSVNLLAFGSVVNIPTILVLPINKVAASFHYLASCCFSHHRHIPTRLI